MTDKPVSRTLVVLLHADVVGSTALVQQDEALAHTRLTDAFHRLSSTIKDYGGTVHEIRGDALVAEFARVSDAVTAALVFQQANLAHNAKHNDAITPVLRMGVSLGEVIIADATVTGPGVVLAQRLEQLAEAGSVCIQQAVYEALPRHLPFDYDALGEQQLKGFDEPVRVYTVKLRRGAEVPAPESRVVPKAPHSRRKGILATIAVTALVLIGVLTWRQPWKPEFEPASVERMAFPLPDKPSVAVLPFDNLSGDQEQAYFADGITNDIITDLSRFGDLVVIAAHSTFTYKGKPVKVQQVAEELGVRYVVEGNVQKAGNQVRINAQFIDAITGEHLWAERYVRELSDVFAVQDEIVQKIVGSLGAWTGQVASVTIKRSKQKGTTDLTAYEYFLLGVELGQRFTKEDNTKARELLEKAIERDPRYARAYAALAWTYFFDWKRGWSESDDLSAARAYELAKKAVELDDNEAEAHWILAEVYFVIRKQPEEAIAEFERALALNPNHADILADWGGYAMPGLTGRAGEGIELVKKAMRLNPSHADWYEQGLGFAAYVARRYDEAISAFRKVEHYGLERAAFAASYAQLGRLEEAHAEVAKFLESQPDFSIVTSADKFYFKNPADLAHYIDGLRKAGFPEHSPLKLPDKPSIAVLPFTNMSDDPKQEYFVDGMTDDLITDLSKLSGLFVIARNSTFAYKGKSPDVRRVSRELGVKYVLEGSVRRAGDRVRINAQLINATTGGHVWAERYDGSLDNVFAMQDEVTQNIVTALAVNLTAGEQERQARKETDSPEAYDAFLRGWAHYRLHTPDDFAKAIPYLENAIELDPSFGRAHAALAAIYREALENEWLKNLGVPDTEAVDKTRRHLEKAMKDPTPVAHRIAAKVHGAGERWDEAIAEAERAIALDPNDPNGYVAMGILLVDVSRSAEGLDFIKKAMRLDPQSDYLYRLGDAQFHLERYDKAAATLLRATKRNPGDEWNFFLLAAAYGQLGREQEAKSAIDTFSKMRLEALKVERPYTLADIDDWAFKEPVERERLREGLRKAGLPEGKAAPQHKPLTADELRTLIPGNTSTGETVFGGGWHVYHAPDGKLLIRTFGGATDEGTWEITEDGRYCRQWRIFGGGRKACFIYFKKGDEYEYWYADGSRMRGKFKARPGNPENLK